MIYLIITTSIATNLGVDYFKVRMDRYIYAISETLKHVPSSVQPIIVENNGNKLDFLERFQHAGKKVPVLYTRNNSVAAKSKGVNEMLDIQSVIREYNIQDNDIIVKLTGRYRLLSSFFLKEIIDQENKYDAWVKFFGSCSLRFEKYDCILGSYAIRVKFLKLFHALSIDNYASAEIAFARYVRFSGARLYEIEKLDLECLFAEDNRRLEV
jgi:hypothetical protein